MRYTHAHTCTHTYTHTHTHTNAHTKVLPSDSRRFETRVRGALGASQVRSSAPSQS